MKKRIVPLLPIWMTTSAALAAAVWLPGANSHAADTDDPALEMWKQDYGPTHDERMQWWREAKFGMFIHWGVYSVPAGTYHGQTVPHAAEWIMRWADIPVAEYASYAKQFDPTNFNADEWVRIAKDAGMKYIVITAKHHDGFAMFHTHVDGYNIYDATPWHHDPLAELADACRKQNIRLGFYYSEAQDWHHPGGAAASKHPEADVDKQHHWDPAQTGSFDEYEDKVAVPQVRELLSNYGPDTPAVLWWDTPVGMTPDRVEKLLPLLKLKPGIITNNRLDEHHLTGDYQTPEQKIPANGLSGDWETCMTINGTWGYKSSDTKFKSAETLIHNLVDIASKGGNYLLNVGPTSAGEIPQPEVERLQEIGEWMKVNGDSIYGTTASPFGHPFDWGRCTEKVLPDKTILYLHVWDWPADGKLSVPNLKNQVAKAYLLKPSLFGERKQLQFASDSDGLNLTLPRTAPDKISSTVVLEFPGTPQIE
ncbi:MAG TPA: alpha-L-fucosidase [Candidatus Sulfotelmatobacter sp.]|nr:alpha-L-fucosidase [Candidatus Sulfotelmatobacter sp.]